MESKKDLILKQLQELTKEDLSDMLLTVQRQLIDAQPKIEFYNAVVQSDSEKDMKEVAKVLNFDKLGRNKLFSILRKQKILMSNNEPYQRYVDQGLFKIVEQKVNLPDGDTIINIKTVVYQKGIDYIRKLLIEMGYELYECNN